jgi:hypothetical protein
VLLRDRGQQLSRREMVPRRILTNHHCWKSMFMRGMTGRLSYENVWAVTLNLRQHPSEALQQ